MDHYLVVGGGVSGIAAAYYLREAGVEVELLEQGECLGGRVGPSSLGGRHLEMGGKNIGRRYRLFREFAARMGEAEFEFFGINSSRVGSDGRLMTVDSTRKWHTAVDLLRTCPTGDLLRFAGLCARVASTEENGRLGSAYFDRLGERRDDQPLSSYFSQAFCGTVIRPMVVRMNGAEPDEVYLGNFGSNIRMLLDTYDQPKRGMQPLLARFAERVPVRLGARATALVVRNRRVVAVEVEGADGRREERPCAGVILGVPARASAELLAPHAPQAAEVLRSVRYFPVVVVVAEYAREVFSSTIRALVFGPEHPLSNAGAYGVDALNVVRYTFSGRAARQAMDAGAGPEELLEIAEGLLARHFPVRAADRLRYLARRFDPGLCAYVPHHARARQALRAGLQGLAGLTLAGDYLKGASIEACFHAARSSVEELLRGRRAAGPIQ